MSLIAEASTELGLSRRTANRMVSAEKWQPPHGREVLERLLAALRKWEPGVPVISLDDVYKTLEEVLGNDAYLSGPDVEGLVERLRRHLMQLVPILSDKAGDQATAEEQEAIGRARDLRAQELPVTHGKARAHVRSLAEAAQTILYLLVEATTVEDTL